MIRRLGWFLLFVGLCGSRLCSASAQTYDLVLRGGRVIDGTGNAAYHADVAIKEGRIVALGRNLLDSREANGNPRTAKKVLDVKGLLVAPGFVDVHTHAENILEHPLAENFARMGVTSLVIGNCGGSAQDIGTFFREMEQKGVALNVASLIGHNTVRTEAMGGSFDRAPTPAEQAKMETLVEKAMKDGAVGLSTGLIYLPGTFSKTEEIVALAKVSSRYGGIYTSHMRSESNKITDALEEVFRIAREADIRAEVSHIKLGGKNNWGRAEAILALLEKARAEGLDITQDQYVYTASSTTIGANLVPSWAREGGGARFRERLADPVQKAKMVTEMKEGLLHGSRTDYSYAVIASCRKYPELNGKNIVEATRLKRNADTLDDQVELILDIEKNGGANGVFHGISEEDLQHFLAHPNTMFASDSSVRPFQEGVPHPRGYGNNARVLAHYVRELKQIRLEEAIRRMTSLPAKTFHLRDRGEIREGAWADIVVFDLEKVSDPSTFSDPHHYATGFVDVLVNGEPIIENGQETKRRPGKALRHRH